MAQLDPVLKNSQTSKSTPKSNSPTFEQLLQGNERNWSINTYPTAYYDQEEYTPTHGKKSVISKVKEKAKKLKHSLSGKKNRHENDVHDNNHTPSWGVTLEDDDDNDDDEDGDPEYLGAPMYESELAPEPLKESARQHPRADPVLSEKHVLPSSIKNDEVIEHDDNTEKLPDSPSKTITETVTEKFAPAYAAVSDATHAIASKISNLTLTNNNDEESEIQNAPKAGQFADQSNVSKLDAPKAGQFADQGNVSKLDAPKAGQFADQSNASKLDAPKAGQFAYQSNASKLAENVKQNHNASGLTSPTQKWDKGVSVKEYFVEKFEPGEGERSLSQIITEAISPRQAASGDIGIMEKMRGAVTSLIRSDENPKTPNNSIKSSASNNPISTSATLSPNNSNLSSKSITISANDNLPQDNPISMPHKSPLSTSNNEPASLAQLPEFHSARSSPLIPISTSVDEVVEEEQSHGRILQAN